MNNNRYCCFYTKTQYYFIINYRGVGEEVFGDEGGLSKWNQAGVIEIS